MTEIQWRGVRLATAALLTSVCFGAAGLAHAQTARRVRVGVALEGGGALALAHIGIVEWFERHQIPIDLVAGASMGGLVGGFYASGMSGQEMRRLVEKLDWKLVVTDRGDDRTLSFRRKQDYRAFSNTVVLGARGGLSLPTGLNPGQNLDLLLNRTLLPYSEMSSFDDLPTPFRCVAADLAAVRDAQKVFANGSLAAALRATMAIPGFFEPAFDGPHEYVDGGLVNNLPVDVVKTMGAELVIAVFLDPGPFRAHEPQSAIDVLRRSVTVTIAANEKRNIEAADLLISVDLDGFGTGDYTRFEELISRGYAAAEKKRTVLSRFALDDESWAQYQTERASKRKVTTPIPQFVEVLGIQGELERIVRSRFADLAERPIDTNEIELRIQEVVGNGAFSSISYRIVERNGASGLSLRVHPSPNRPPILQPALFIDGADYLNSRTAFAVRFSALDLGNYRTEWRNDLIFGSTYGLRSEFFRPFRPMGRWFVAPHMEAITMPFDIYRRSAPLSLNRISTVGGGADLGYSFGNTAEWRAGYETAYWTTRLRVGDPTPLRELSGRYGAVRTSYTFNSLDDQIVPHRGVYGQTTARWIESSPGFRGSLPVAESRWSGFVPLSEQSTVYLHGAGGTAFGRRNSGLPLFYLGGPQQLSAYGWNELYGNQYYLARAGWLRQLSSPTELFGIKLYLLANVEAGKMYGALDSPRLPLAANGGVVVRTLLGPLLLGASVGNAGHHKWYLQFGRLF